MVCTTTPRPQWAVWPAYMTGYFFVYFYLGGTMGTSAAGRKQRRSIVYIDGFNLYYGVLKNGPYKWLNLERYFRLLRPGDDIQRIRYFTARIWGPGVKDQDAYLDALATSPMIDIILGQFKKKRVRGECTQCPLPSPQFFYKTEEKCTDVNIAL